jgi:hypothetical protein
MGTIDYPEPVDKLLTYGRPEPSDAQNWPDYLELGLGPEHIPDLLRMTADEELWEAGEDASENWAPVHAWRALGQLRAVNALEPLLHLLVERVRDDWAIDELPQVYGLIGAAAIPTIEAYLADKSHQEATGLIAESLEIMTKLHPEDKPEAVAALIRLLENFEENDEELNGALISSLVDLKVLEALPLIERAFAANRVDEFMTGDWDNVQVELGLKEAPPESPIFYDPFERRGQPISPDQIKIISPSVMATPNPRYFSSGIPGERKTKNKKVKQSRKKNKKRR